MRFLTMAAAALLALVSLAAATAAAEQVQKVSFTQKPTVAKDGDKAVKITFALSAATDVEVAVLSADGKIVRHLAAGLLGPNAPAPFKKDSLAQELTWDGKDDAGQPVAAGELGKFKVRVSAGLTAGDAAEPAFGTEPKAEDLTNVVGLAAGPDGRVFVLSDRWQRAWWTHTAIHVFNRKGQYEKTIKPFPATLPADKLAKLTPLKDEQGHVVPVIHRVLAIDYYAGEDMPQQMAVTPDGNLHLLNLPDSYIGDRYAFEARYIASLAPDGGLAYDAYVGPKLPCRTLDVGDAYLAPASDGKSLLVTGMDITVKKEWSPDDSRPAKINVPAVFKVDLPARAEAKAFFGDPDKSGDDAAHLSDPRGVAVDGKGKLFIADRGNNRVLIVSEKDAKLAGTLEVKSPTWLAVHPKTGALYVATAGGVTKFVAGADGKYAEKARLALPTLAPRDQASCKWSFALDSSAEPAMLWVGLSRGGDALQRCEDQGDKFGPLEKANFTPAKFYWSLCTGFDGKTVGCKVGDRTLRLMDEETGQTRDLKLADTGGQMYRLGPNNQIYGMDHSGGIKRWDSAGKVLPFPDSTARGETAGRLPVHASGTTNWERDFDVDRAGNVYAKQRGKVYHGRMTVDKYDANGKLLGPVIWIVSDGAQGPRLDAAGNLYIAESLKPVGQQFPDYFKGKLPKVNVDHKSDVEGQYRWMYGSIVKFGPVGGQVLFPIPDPKSDIYPYNGEPQLPADQGKVKVDTVSGDRVITRTGELQGAQWFRFGVSYILDMQPGANRRCHCTGTDFQVDPYGRTFYTDQGRFRVVVLDTGGNEVLAFGRYGNQDSAPPEVAFNWFTGLGASDRYVYVADGGNRRVVRVALKHAAEETAALAN